MTKTNDKNAKIVAKLIEQGYGPMRDAFNQVEAAYFPTSKLTVSFKFPKDGAGTVRAFIYDKDNSFCLNGKAGGYGYDKRGASINDAIRTFKPLLEDLAAKGNELAAKLTAWESSSRHGIGSLEDFLDENAISII